MALKYVHKQFSTVMELNLENPTGSYTFDLGKPGDRAAAERLLLLSRWETATWEALG